MFREMALHFEHHKELKLTPSGQNADILMTKAF